MPELVRSSCHPDDRHYVLRQVRLGEVHQVSLTRYDALRGEGSVVSSITSCSLSAQEARRLFEAARLDSLEGSVEQIRRASPRPKGHVSRATAKSPGPIQLTPAALDALQHVVQWMSHHKKPFPGRSAAMDLAIQEAARARGWRPSGPPSSPPTEGSAEPSQGDDSPEGG